MATIAFDTFAAANRFKRAGFTDDQVEALVAVTRETTDLPDISSLATKADLDALERKLGGDIARLEGRLAHLDAKLDAGLAHFDAKLASGLAQSDVKLEAATSRLEAKIATTQVQTLTIIISSTAVMVTLATVLSRLIR